MIAAKKMLLTRALRPFVKSGSFETGLEGWTLSAESRRISGRGRTGTFSVQFLGDGAGPSYALEAKDAGGLMIRFGAAFNHSQGRAISLTARYFVDGQEVQSERLSSSGGGDNNWYELAAAGYLCPRGKGISIRLDASGANLFMDDWIITGARS